MLHVLALVLNLTTVQDGAHPVSVIPRPVSVAASSGTFTLTTHTVIWTDSATAAIGHYLARALAPATGFPLGAPPPRGGGEGARG
jgi:hypothetical protein